MRTKTENKRIVDGGVICFLVGVVVLCLSIASIFNPQLGYEIALSQRPARQKYSRFRLHHAVYAHVHLARQYFLLCCLIWSSVTRQRDLVPKNVLQWPGA